MINSYYQPKSYLKWDGRNGKGGEVKSDVYVYQHIVDGKVMKEIMLK